MKTKTLLSTFQDNIKKTWFVISLVMILLLPAVASSCGSNDPETGTYPETKYAMALAERFTPVFFLKGDGDRTESYEPASIETLVNLAVFQETDNQEFSEKASIPGMKEFSGSSYYLDVPDLSPANAPAILPGYKETYDLVVQEGYPPTVYARVMESVDGEYTVLQYWLFYYFNDWRNVHEGDWELVQIVFPDNSAEEIANGGIEPLFAAYSQHQAGQRMDWRDMKSMGLVEGTHPSVYVAQGSHANYFTPGQYWSVLDFDDTGLVGWQRVEPEDIVILAEDGDLDWLDFQGKWGENLSFSISVKNLTFGQSGPNGPSWGGDGEPSGRWQAPYAWSAELPEYPSPFWTSFIPGLADFWDELAVFSVFSPADLHVYDGEGRHVGLNKQGEVEIGIPGAEYINPEGTDYKTIVIPGGDVTDEFRVQLEGTGDGQMDIITQVPDSRTEAKRFLRFDSIPVTRVSRAKMEISPDVFTEAIAPSSDGARDTSTKLEIDTDGDGIYESEVKPGSSTISAVTPTTKPTTTTTTTKPTRTTTTTPAVIKEFLLTVRTEGKGRVDGPDADMVLEKGELVTMTAVADIGWVFDHWEGDITGDQVASPTIAMVMDDDKEIRAVFREEELETETVLDQSNEPIWDGESAHAILRPEIAIQSFVPDYRTIKAVEIAVSPNELGFFSANLTLRLYDENGVLLGSDTIFLEANTQGWVRFDFPETIAVERNAPVYMVVTSDTAYVFGWNYAGDTYPEGAGTYNGDYSWGDFFFRVYVEVQVTNSG